MLALLTTVYGLSYVDRQLLGLLIEPIKAEIQLTDTQLGFLGGVAFAIFYATLGVPIARLADRRDRRRIIAASLACFSLATAACGAAHSFGQLLAARIFVGVGEAGTSPPSHSIIADLYRPERRAGALAILTVGAQLGVLAGFLAVGFIATAHGWREAFLALALCGLVVSLLLLTTVHEPVRTEARHETLHGARHETRGVRSALRELGAIRSFRWMALGNGLTLFALNASSTWIPAWLQRAHGLTTAQVALLFGVGVGIIGIAATLSSGYLANRHIAAAPHRLLQLMALPVVLNGAATAAALFAGQTEYAVALLLLPLALSAFYQAPLFTLVQGVAPTSLRATASAIMMLAGNLVGMGLGPLAVGLMSDSFGNGGDADGLGRAVAIAMLAAPLAALAFLRAGQTLAADLAAVDPSGGAEDA